MTSILLIEDHAPLRKNLREMLTFEGYDVIEASDGREGLRLARERKPSLILCDIMLPGIDGLEILAALRSDASTATLPFIFLTAKGEAPDIRAGMNLGADDYIPKPVARADLLNAVRTRLSRQAQLRAQFALRFDTAAPLEKLGLSVREAEVLLWVAQGKGNHDIATILGLSPATVKKHTLHIFEKLGVETRGAAMLCAIEALSGTR
ncbi:MAG TPA: response regulator transcription factor [Roseimicrobium sp.]|nr:response regulator transcription factor [Roseimicrobium sp.]